MQAFTSHTGTGAPLKRSNVDTDQILPSKYLKRVTRSGFEDALFATWRTDPAFVLNQPEHAGASVLVAGMDFGTGSSREGAVWALQNYGFRAVIAPRFGDIFRSNSGKAGLLAVQLAEPLVVRLWGLLERHPEQPITVDLDNLVVSAGVDFREPFEYDAYTRWRLMNGLDDVAITLRSADRIAEFEQTRPSHKPVVPTPAVASAASVAS